MFRALSQHKLAGKVLGIRKCFAGLAVFLAAGLLFAQSRTAPSVQPIADLTPATAGQAITQFRATRFASDFCFRFELTHFPRKGDETVYDGFLWGAPTPEGAHFRLLFWKRGDPENKRQFLMYSGAQPHVWTGGAGQPVRELSTSGQYEPLAPGLLYSPFDVMMPFVYWPDWTYEGPKRVQSRSTDLFLFRAPAAWSQAHPEQSGVRVALDRTFNALIYAQLIESSGKTLRTFRIVDLKKVKEQWVVKRVDFMDETTRDKDRFAVTAAALPLRINPKFFTPEAMQALPKPLDEELFTVF